MSDCWCARSPFLGPIPDACNCPTCFLCFRNCEFGGCLQYCRGVHGARWSGNSFLRFMVRIDDTHEDMELIAQKILNLKAFPDPNTGAQWKATVVDRGGELLCVSQFTLFAKIIKNKPDFHKAMPAESSKSMYTTFLERMGTLYDPLKIKDGRFGAMMSVALTNEGPVTFTLDSREVSGTTSTGTSTPTASASASKGREGADKLAQRNAEKALRRAAWEAAK